MLKAFMIKNIKKNQNLRLFDDLDNLDLIENKVCLVGKKKANAKKARMDKDFQRMEDLENITELNYTISSVTKAPDEIRLIAIGDIPTRNISKIVREATSRINNHPDDKYGKPLFGIPRQIAKRPNSTYFMMDQKKSGWTFPMELISAYFEVCKEIYPDFRLFENMYNIFKQKRINYLFGNSRTNPLRGFILGMWDNIASFITCNIFSIFKENMERKHTHEGLVYLKGLFYGDDSIVEFNGPIFLINQLWNKWIFIVQSYGFKVNEKKSFYADIGIFCEQYGENPNFVFNKSVLSMLTLFDSLRGVNITHQKFLFSVAAFGCLRTGPYVHFSKQKDYKEKISKLIPLLQSIIGFEFNQNEYNLPRLFGGWKISLNQYGENTLLDDMKELGPIDPGFYNVALLDYKETYGKVNKNLYDLAIDNENFKNLIEIDSLTDSKTGLKFDFTLDKLKRLRYSNKTSETKLEMEFWDKEMESRQKAFSNKNKPSKGVLIEHLFKNGKFHRIPIVERDLQPINLGFEHIFLRIPQDPYKGEFIDSTRALLIIKEIASGKDSFSITKEHFLKEISFKTLIASLYKDLVQLKVAVPLDWYLWCHYCRHSIKKMYYDYLEESIDIFDYEPPLCDIIRTEVRDVFSRKYIIWDNYYGDVVIMNQHEITEYGTSGYLFEKFRSEQLGISFEEYHMKASIRDPPYTKEIDEEDLGLELFDRYPEVDIAAILKKEQQERRLKEVMSSLDHEPTLEELEMEEEGLDLHESEDEGNASDDHKSGSDENIDDLDLFGMDIEAEFEFEEEFESKIFDNG
jgi:hypothetical protein